MAPGECVTAWYRPIVGGQHDMQSSGWTQPGAWLEDHAQATALTQRRCSACRAHHRCKAAADSLTKTWEPCGSSNRLPGPWPRCAH